MLLGKIKDPKSSNSDWDKNVLNKQQLKVQLYPQCNLRRKLGKFIMFHSTAHIKFDSIYRWGRTREEDILFMEF